jgi:excisionase family DNA binding protein
MHKYCRIKELAEYTGLCTKTIYAYVERNILPCIKLEGSLLFDMEEIEKFLQNKHTQNKENCK